MKDDRQLEADLQAELVWDAAVQLEGVEVAVHDGVATVSGRVGSFGQHDVIARAAHRVAGLRGLVLRLDVRLPPEHRRSDEELRQAALSALHWNSLVPDGMVKVEVEDGWMTLMGQADFEYQRASAEQCLQSMVGICALDNKITLKERADAGDIGAGIAAALARHARREAGHIAVAADGGVVTLRGTVGSLAEHEAAIGTALGAPGVVRVVDQLEIAGGAGRSNP